MQVSSKGFAFSLFIGVLLVGMFANVASAAMGDVTEYSIPTPNSQPDGIASGPDGNLWFTEFGGAANKVARMNTSGTVLNEYALPTPNAGPRGITAGPGNFMYFTEWSANKIGRINTTNGNITEFPIPTANSQPFGITLGPDGNIWFTESAGNKIGKLIPGTGAILEYTIPVANSQPTSIAAGPDGNLWFTMNNASSIGTVTPAGVITSVLTPTANSQPSGIVAGTDGRMWFTETNADNVAASTMGGVITEYTLGAGANPIGIVSAGDGNNNLWVAEAGHNEISQIDVLTGSIIDNYPVPTAAAITRGITNGPDGNLWFTEYGVSQIGTVESGADLSVTALSGPLTTTVGSGTVFTLPAGSPAMNCASAQLPGSNTCTSRYQPPAAVTLTASPNPGSYFLYWSGGDCGALNISTTCNITMDEDRSTDALFWKAWNLDVTTTGILGGSGTVAGITGFSAPYLASTGITGCQTAPAALGDCNQDYFAGETTPSSYDVELVPTAAAGSQFTGWTGACSGIGQCIVTMDQARNVNAEFTEAWDLTVTKTPINGGSGTVTSSPAGINCGGTCVATFLEPTMVTLTPTPAAGSRFGGWAGDCVGMGACVVTMDMARSVDATFIKTYNLTVTKSGTGGGTVTSAPVGINCGATCTFTFDAGTAIALTGLPDGTSTFTGWGAPCVGNGACNFVLNSDMSVNADFARVTHTLNVSKTGAGSGTVTSSPSGIDCGATCSKAFTTGTVVTLSATPSPTSVFTGWSGEGCSGTGTCVVTLGVDRNVTADFAGVTPFEQADNLVRVRGGGSFIGQNIYNLDGAGQMATATAALNKTVVFDVMIENDGTNIDQFTMRGPGTSSGVKITYTDGSGDITAAVKAGTYTTPEIDPVLGPDTGRPNSWTIKVRMTGKTNGRHIALITSRSVADPADGAADAVKARLRN